PALVYGAYRLVQPEHPTIYAYTRDNGDQRMLVVLNFSERPATIDLSDYPLAGTPAINNYAGVRVKEDRTELLPYQAIVWELE
ncbi:MAG: alpha-glucosidase C-terminal domain-containing protein, partial [Saprospiraceae bacterium]